MSGPLYGACRRDAAEPEVRDEFEAGGASVTPLSGKDIPDLLVGYRGSNHLVEVKTNNAKLRPGQKRWHDDWAGARPEVARNAAQARKLMRMWAEAVPELADVLRANHAAHADPEPRLAGEEDAA